MVVHNLNDHRAYVCPCGSVHFNFRASGQLECTACSSQDAGVWASVNELTMIDDFIERLKYLVSVIEKQALKDHTAGELGRGSAIALRLSNNIIKKII